MCPGNTPKPSRLVIRVSTKPNSGRLRVGIFGAGKVGTTLGRLALASGYPVQITGSGRDPWEQMIVSSMLPGAQHVSAAELAANDIVVLAVPLGKATSVDLAALSGKIVIDAMNHWYPTDGDVPGLSDAASTSHYVAGLNPEMRLVKTLNHLGYHDMEIDATRPGTPGRRGLGVASDDLDARALVARFVNDLGFDPVELPFSDAHALDGDGPVFGVRMDAATLHRTVAGARGRAA